MDQSLSILLPVRDAQSTLADTVERILEVASDLTGQFEVVIIDDGSTDDTSEVAEELRRDYPQIRAVRHGKPRGERESLRRGLQMCRGRVVLCRDPATDIRVDDLPRVWKSLAAGSVPPPPTQPSYHVIDRRTGTEVHGPSRPARPNFLARVRDFALGE